MNCTRCQDTGVIETGNNDLPCNCVAGDVTQFNVAGVGQIDGASVKRHHLNNSPEPLADMPAVRAKFEELTRESALLKANQKQARLLIEQWMQQPSAGAESDQVERDAFQVMAKVMRLLK